MPFKIIYLKTVIIFFFLLAVKTECDARVPQAVADSIARLINQAPESCDRSCVLYDQEHPGVSLTNTVFISLLLVIGSFWLYYTYKKKYIVVSGIVLAVLVMGSYFARPLLTSGKVPDNCPIVESKSKTDKLNTVFVKPGSEFVSADTSQNSDSLIKVNEKDEFSPISTNEFSTLQDRTHSPSKVLKERMSPDVYEPIIIFILLGLIGFFIRYAWFRKMRGVVLLAGLIYLGFFRSACPCMISGFENSVLALFGANIKWTSLLWFLVLIPATYLFGKVWCGWLCHLGALQEFLYKSPKLKWLMTLRAQRTLKIIQYSVFIIWIIQMLFTGTNLFCKYDPFKSAFNLIAADVTGYVLLGILLVSSVLIYRPFCRMICPVGLVLGWIILLPGARRLHKNKQCIDCTSCSKECKQKAMINENKKTVLREQDCIMCGECISSCHKDALKIKRNGFKSKTITIVIILLSIPSLTRAQWECPSRLGGSLKPFGSSNLNWAGELTTSAGFIGSDGLANAMFYGGLDYSVNNHTLYVEGGVKSWYRWGNDINSNNSVRFGLREAYYRNTGNNYSLTLGLQSVKSDDYFMINERMAGINYQLSSGNFHFNLLGGSVMKEFARNGTFCTLGYLYNIIPGRDRTILGKDFGQTNLSMLSVTWKPKAKDNLGDFSTGDGLEQNSKSKVFNINSAGAFIYHEFGNWVLYKTFHSGVYADFSLLDINLKPEIILQSGSNNNALIYSFTAEKQFTWNNGQQSKFFGRYITQSKIDENAMAIPSFTNIFAGEVLRLDALDMPFVQAGFKHSFPAAKASIKLQGALQTGIIDGFTADDYNSTPTKMKELDLTLSKNFGKYVLVNAMAGYLSYPKLTTDDQAYLKYTQKNSLWGKIEMRITF